MSLAISLVWPIKVEPSAVPRGPMTNVVQAPSECCQSSPRNCTANANSTGISAPSGTRVLIAPLEGVGRDYPLSIEKLCPVLSYYVVRDWREGCERCKEILRYGGMGHTMSIHSQNQQVVLEFGLKKPAFRIVVNTPTTLGSIGLTTGLDPAMTLGCGGYGGNITSDNISPRHLLNIKRLAYEVTPVAALDSTPANRGAQTAAEPQLPKAPSRAAEPAGLSADLLGRRIDRFLESRGYHSEPVPAPPPTARTEAGGSPLDFVCEDDVRTALKEGRKVVIDDKTIVTPSARDLGEAQRVFAQAGWPG